MSPRVPVDGIVVYVMATVRRSATALGLIACLLAAGTPAFAQLPSGLATLSAEEKAELAESYYLSGLQYREVGKDDLADGMIRLAFRLNPDLDPEAIAEPAPPEIAPPAAPSPPEPTADRTAWTANLVVSQLLRVAGAFLDGDAGAIVAALDGSVYVAGASVTRAQAHVVLDALFERHSLDGISLRDIYDVDGMSVAPYGGNGALADAFEVNLDARMDLSAAVPFWAAEQRFVLRPVDGVWLVSAVLFSDATPPANWSPAPMESADAAERRLRAAAARKQEAADRTAARQALLDGVDRFLEKDTDGTLAAVDRVVQNPDGSSVTREVLRALLDGYFARTPYRGLNARDIIAVGSAEPLGDGAGYRVELSFEDRYQEALPVVRSGQRLHLRDADGRWVIFAIS